MDTATAILTEDDTQQSPVLRTRAIVNADFTHGYNALNGSLVIYRHYSDSRKQYFGHILTAEAGKFGITVFVQPVPGMGISLVKSYHVSDVKLVGGAE